MQQPACSEITISLTKSLACLQEPAYLLRQTVNLEQRGEVREETLSSGHYSLIDIRCKCCHAAIGWQYLRASNPVSCPAAALMAGKDAGHVLPLQWALCTSGPLLQVPSLLPLGRSAVFPYISNLMRPSSRLGAGPMLLRCCWALAVHSGGTALL